MIEDVMIFALGFCVATLLALACLPVIWRRATRLVRRRLEMLVPLSMAEIDAERDGLKARAAVTERQIEQRMDRAVTAAGVSAVELGRRTVELVAAQRNRDEVAATRDRLQGELDDSRAASLALQSTIETMEVAARDAAVRLEASLAEGRTLQATRTDLEAAIAEAGKTLANTEAERSALQLQLIEIEATVEKARTEQIQLRATLAERTEERDLARKDALLSSTQRTELQKQLLDEARRTEDYSGRWRLKSDALSSAERRIVDQTAELKTSTAALKELKQRFDALEARLLASHGDRPYTPDEAETEVRLLRAAIVDVADDALRVLHAPALDASGLVRPDVPADGLPRTAALF